MTRTLAFLLQAALASAAVIHQHNARQEPSAGPPADLSGLGNLGKLIPKDYKPPPGLPPSPLMLGPPKIVKSTSRVQKPATIRPEAKRFRVSYGPFSLLAKGAEKTPSQKGSLDPNGQSESFLVTEGLCADCTVLGGNIMLTNKNGDIIGPKEGVYTHHFISINIDKEGLTPPISRCAQGDTPPQGMPALPAGQKMPFSTFIGRGEDGGLVDYLYTSAKGPIEFGYHLRKDDKIMVNADLVNYKGDQQELYLTYEIEYVEGIHGVDTSSGLLSVGSCNPFTKPNISQTGRSETVSKPYNVEADAVIVSARGHLHPGGEKMQLKVNDRLVCESMAEYDDKGYISAMTLCPEPIPIKKGDHVSMVSVYDVKKHPLRPGAGHDETFAASAFGGGPDIMGMWIIAYGEKE